LVLVVLQPAKSGRFIHLLPYGHGAILIGYLIISTLVIAFPVAMELRRPNPNMLEPVLLFNYGFFASYFFKGMLIEWNPELFITYPNFWTWPDDLLPYFLISWAALCLFNIGYYAWPRSNFPNAAPATFPSANYRLLFLLLIIVSTLSALQIATRISFDYSSLLHSVEAWEQYRHDVMFTWLDGGYAFVGPLFVGFFHLSYEVYARPYGLRAERLVALLLTIFVFIVIGGRALLLSWVISLVLYRSIWIKPISLRTQAIVLVALPLVGGVLGILQKITTVGKTALEQEFPVNIFFRLSSSYEQFENLVNMLNTRVDFDWGYSIFEDVVLTYIPRFIIPFKPIDYGFMRVQTVLFGDIWSVARDSTYPVGSLAELYFNFGYPGIMIGMLALGAILFALRRAAFRNPRFIAPLCAMGGMFLAPHRWYGCVLLALAIYLGLTLVNAALVWFFELMGQSTEAAAHSCPLDRTASPCQDRS